MLYLRDVCIFLKSISKALIAVGLPGDRGTGSIYPPVKECVTGFYFHLGAASTLTLTWNCVTLSVFLTLSSFVSV
jgi:hypothetical protein